MNGKVIEIYSFGFSVKPFYQPISNALPYRMIAMVKCEKLTSRGISQNVRRIINVSANIRLPTVYNATDILQKRMGLLYVRFDHSPHHIFPFRFSMSHTDCAHLKATYHCHRYSIFIQLSGRFAVSIPYTYTRLECGVCMIGEVFFQKS